MKTPIPEYPMTFLASPTLKIQGGRLHIKRVLSAATEKLRTQFEVDRHYTFDKTLGDSLMTFLTSVTLEFKMAI